MYIKPSTWHWYRSLFVIVLFLSSQLFIQAVAAQLALKKCKNIGVKHEINWILKYIYLNYKNLNVLALPFV